MSLTPHELVRQIHSAFDFVEIPIEDDILTESARNYIDAVEMRVALVGKHWSAIPIDALSFHRSTVAELGPVGLRAYVAAFLVAALSGDRRAPDIYRNTLFAFYALDATDQDLNRTRLSLLDSQQRSAIIEWLRYFADYDLEASRVLDIWTTEQNAGGAHA